MPARLGSHAADSLSHYLVAILPRAAPKGAAEAHGICGGRGRGACPPRRTHIGPQHRLPILCRGNKMPARNPVRKAVAETIAATPLERLRSARLRAWQDYDDLMQAATVAEVHDWGYLSHGEHVNFARSPREATDSFFFHGALDRMDKTPVAVRDVGTSMDAVYAGPPRGRLPLAARHAEDWAQEVDYPGPSDHKTATLVNFYLDPEHEALDSLQAYALGNLKDGNPQGWRDSEERRWHTSHAAGYLSGAEVAANPLHSPALLPRTRNIRQNTGEQRRAKRRNAATPKPGGRRKAAHAAPCKAEAKPKAKARTKPRKTR